MDIKVLGTGCSKCHNLKKMVEVVVCELGIDAKVQEVKDMRQILEYPILTTPGLVVNDEVKCFGRVPTKAEITQMITNTITKETK